MTGIGPGSKEQMTEKAIHVLESCDLIIGYTVYIELARSLFPEKQYRSTPMRKEEERCRMALEEADSGKSVAMICSGDAGIYGMASLLCEMKIAYPEVELEIVPGVTAATAGAALLGAPLNHDFCVISLSDLLTPWEKIEKRILGAAMADFIIVFYNPSSRKRKDYLKKACELVLCYQKPETVCGLVSCIGREGESVRLLTLETLQRTQVDMFTTVYIGNSQTRVTGGRMITPRGYRGEGDHAIFTR